MEGDAVWKNSRRRSYTPVARIIRQHPVAIAGAEQFPHRQAHLPGEFARQNVSEIPRGHGKIYRVPHADDAPAQQIPIGLEIIGHLRRKPAKINGIGAGKPHRLFLQPRLQPFVGEDGLHAGLRVVEIAPNSADPDVLALAG